MSGFNFTLELGGLCADVYIKYNQVTWKANEYEPAGADDAVVDSVEVVIQGKTSEWVHENVSDEFLAEAINTSGYYFHVNAGHITYGGDAEDSAPEVIDGTMDAFNKLTIRGEK